ncbi:hypothetical protein RIF29_08187 [Crotalaria pallida]|uniref:Senescence regulator n=1 Tax=Crotalaria pallida TaxID=3830 RepID=A0AAN9J6T1_CROPI
MAKGLKFPSSRLLGTTTFTQPSADNDSSEFREEDIWSTPDERDRHPPEPRRRISEGHRRHPGGLSLAFEDRGGINGRTATNSSRIVHHHYRAHDVVSSPRGHHRNMATSAPVNVPDWSKILRGESVESLRGMDDGFEFDDEEREMVPPHEYLARSRKKAANSVFEGVGRTLKGRDMSRVRDAVWSQTGFNG